MALKGLGLYGSWANARLIEMRNVKKQEMHRRFILARRPMNSKTFGSDKNTILWMTQI